MGEPLPDTFSSFDIASIPSLDTLFLAVPHGQSHHWLKTLLQCDHIGKIIDLSADFRVKDPKKFKQYYEVDHQSPELLDTIPLGLPELYRDQIRTAKTVACPSCYSTSAIIALYPLAKKGYLSHHVIIDSKSGVSGAGKSLNESNLYCEANESVTAYGTGTHRHTAEIEQELQTSVIFSPHLVPMMRGILSSCYVTVPHSTDVRGLYHDFYKDEPFITVYEDLETTSTKYVVGSNIALLSFKKVSESSMGDHWVIFSALDNLVKGASGQAIQVMNIMAGTEADHPEAEAEGLLFNVVHQETP